MLIIHYNYWNIKIGDFIIKVFSKLKNKSVDNIIIETLKLGIL
jgi:hypothetical protein